MKKRIGTKLYDTDRSEFICESGMGKIYRKRTGLGEYFAYNEDRDKVIPLEYDLAKEIVKDVDRSVYEKYFSLRGKSDEKRLMNFSFTEYEIAKLRRFSSQRNRTMSRYIIWLMEQDEKRLLNKQED